MDHALRVHHHLNLAFRHIEKPPGFHNLQSLVKHAGRIHRDFGAHIPVGVLQSLSPRSFPNVLFLPRSERSSRSRQQNLLRLVFSRSLEALKNGAVLTVHRQDGPSLLFRLFHYQVPPCDQGFLVSQQHLPSRFQSVHNALQSGNSHDADQHHVRFYLRRSGPQGFLSAHPLAELQILRHFFLSDTIQQPRHFRPELPHLGKQLFLTALRSQSNNPVFLRMPPADVQGLGTDGSG